MGTQFGQNCLCLLVGRAKAHIPGVRAKGPPAPTADLLCAFAPESAANLLVPPQLAPCCSLLLSLLVSCLVFLLVSLLVSPELGGCHDDFPLSLRLPSCLLS